MAFPSENAIVSTLWGMLFTSEMVFPFGRWHFPPDALASKKEPNLKYIVKIQHFCLAFSCKINSLPMCTGALLSSLACFTLNRV